MRGKRNLYEQYWQKDKPVSQIVSESGAGRAGVRNLLTKWGIPLKSAGGGNGDCFVLSMRPREWLFTEYWVKDKTVYEIAEENGVTRTAVRNALKSKDPPIRVKPSSYRLSGPNKIHPNRGWDNGYIIWGCGRGENGKKVKAAEHRITAIGKWGLDAVKGKHVHHANDIPWLNVPEFGMDIPELENPNLVPLDPVTHAKQ